MSFGGGPAIPARLGHPRVRIFHGTQRAPGGSDVSAIRQAAIDEATRAYEQWLGTLAGRALTFDPVTILHDFVPVDRDLILACTIQVVYRERVRDFL